jgi:hypothetical protein
MVIGMLGYALLPARGATSAQAIASCAITSRADG